MRKSGPKVGSGFCRYIALEQKSDAGGGIRCAVSSAGVRFRAWAPPHSLHAHLGIHHPLCFDVLDRWSQRSLGACTYHVWHPEGRAFSSPPLTRFEAAARRSQRFTRGDQSPYPVDWTAAEAHREGPHTLDLRRHDIDRAMPQGPTEEAPKEPRLEDKLVIAWS